MGVQLFWADFDMPVTVVPLKVALGCKKFVFWAFPKNNHGPPLDTHLPDYFFEMPKNQIFCILMQLLMVPPPRSDQKLPCCIIY